MFKNINKLKDRKSYHGFSFVVFLESNIKLSSVCLLKQDLWHTHHISFIPHLLKQGLS